MDSSQQIETYEAQIIQFLSEYREGNANSEEYHRHVVIDRENRHYQLIATGWASPNQYVDALLIHLQIKPNGKIWLLENGTEIHVAGELEKRGIDKTDIVLAFHPPQYRALSGYAVA